MQENAISDNLITFSVILKATSQDFTGPCPYCFEPCRIRRNVEPESINEEQTESETNRSGNTEL